ncbi:receptor like protein kinase S.2-like isoform X2 [Euphorbia lathyris]
MDDDGVGLDNSMDDYGFDLDISIENDTVDLDKTVDDGEGTDLYESMDNDFIRATGARKFSYNALVQATNNFSEEEKLGEGGFGAVYKGFLKELNCSVAVKRVSRDSKQGIKEYAYEVKIISQLRHRNVVKLIGWCHEKKELLLVYEFMSNGSLDSHIFKESSLLTWEIRYKIALGLALGLRYLQEELEQYVIHRDIKASNVMLDPDFNPKLGDFGLARLVKQGRGPNETPLAGTPGYVAPEYATTGKASKESDVYSFGIVALEIACGRKIIDRKAREDQINLKEWVWDLYGEGKLLEAADPRLNGDFDKQQVERLMIVGLWCAHPDSKLRPTIEKAIHVLNYVAPLPDLPSKMPLVSYFAPFSMSSSSADLVGINNSSLTDLVPARNNFSEQVKVRKTNFGALYKGFLRLRELNSYIGVKKGSNDDRRSRPKVSSNPMEIDPRVQNNSEKLITFLTYKELITYTDGLSVRNLIGSGTLGYIYHGIIKGKWKRNLNGQHIAIQFSRSEDERATILWQKEVDFLTKVIHPNIINLIGYWKTQAQNLFLVYPFMPNGTINKKLEVLNWSSTLKIIKGIASAIQQLHEHDPPLFHGDLWLGNIWLDKDFTPKLTNFGTITRENKKSPSGKRSSDIYSFGMMILRLITKNENGFGECNYTWKVVDWAAKTHRRKGHLVSEKLISTGCSIDAAISITKIGFRCVKHEIVDLPKLGLYCDDSSHPSQCPTIAQILQMLADFLEY